MQISSKCNTPNFGMSVKISPRAKTKIAQKPTQYLNKLGEINEEFKNSKYVDIFIRDDLTPVIQLKGRNLYYSDIKINAFPKDSIVTASVVQEKNPFGQLKGKERIKKFKFDSPEQARQLYKDLKNVEVPNQGLTKMGIIAQAFEASSIRKPMI